MLLWLGLNPALAQSPAPTTNAPTPNAPPRALPVNPATANMGVPNGVTLRWYGHGFVYLTSSFGIRCAIDPFGTDTVHYAFPQHVAADFVLITHEAEDAGAADQIFGDPLIFRSVMAVGLNRANGIPFQGVALHKDPENPTQGLANTAYTIKFDGVRFCYLGQMYGPLMPREKQQLDKCDVLFLPVGLENMGVAELDQVASDLGARMIIPVTYRTDLSGVLQLRSLDEFLSATKFPVRKLDTNEIVVTRDTLPARPTIYCLQSPTARSAPPPDNASNQ
jgi:L-ascorbate metabolism protein UlaG (beta-lactamase superfamily)